MGPNQTEISERLDGLSVDELRTIRDYERRNKDRATLLQEIERNIEAVSQDCANQDCLRRGLGFAASCLSLCASSSDDPAGESPKFEEMRHVRGGGEDYGTFAVGTGHKMWGQDPAHSIMLGAVAPGRSVAYLAHMGAI